MPYRDGIGAWRCDACLRLLADCRCAWEDFEPPLPLEDGLTLTGARDGMAAWASICALLASAQKRPRRRGVRQLRLPFE